MNKPGQIIGSFVPVADEVSAVPLAPYSEVFGLQRFRENELIHGRWAMLACLGALVQEAVTGDSWVAAQVRNTALAGLCLGAFVACCMGNRFECDCRRIDR